MQTLSRYLPPAVVSLAFLALFVPHLGSLDTLIVDPDVGWHIAAGELIRTLGKVPLTDSWSYASGGETWLNISWLWDVSMSWLHDIGGLYATAVANIIIAALSLAIITWFAHRRGIATIPLLLTMALAASCFGLTTYVRPHLLNTLFTIALYIILFRYIRKEITPLYLLILLPLFALWGNIHGGFVGGFIMLAMYGAQLFLEKDWRRFRILFSISIGCLLALMLNPYGAEIYLAPGRTLFSGLLDSFVTEWHALGLRGSDAPAFLYALLVVALFGVYAPNLPLAERGIIVLWLLMSFSSARAITILAIVSFYPLALGLTQMLDRLQKYAPHFFKEIGDHRLSTYPTPLAEPKARIGLSVTVLFALWLAIGGAGRSLYPLKDFSPVRHPVQEITFFQEHYSHLRLLNHYNLGGYIIYKTKGEVPIFTDGRTRTAYSEESTKDMIIFHQFKDGWWEIPDKYEADALLLPKVPGVHRNVFNSPYMQGWTKVFEGLNSALYVRSKHITEDSVISLPDNTPSMPLL